MIKFPNQTKTLVQTNRSKLLGDIWASFNLDLQSSLGALRLTPRLMVNTAGVSNQGRAVAFKVMDNLFWALAGTRVFKTSALDLTGGFTEDVSTGAVTSYDPNYSDMEIFNGSLCTTTTDNKLMSKAEVGSGTGAWTLRYALTATTQLHKLCYSPKWNRLYVLDDSSSIKSLDTSWTTATSGDYFITLPVEYGRPYTMYGDAQYIWIGMSRMNPDISQNHVGFSSVLTWDGLSAQITNQYVIPAGAVLAMCPDDKGVMHLVDSNGSLRAFNGNNFEEIARLPLNRSKLTNSMPSQYNSFIHPNGMVFTKNGTFQILVNNLVNDNTGSIHENLPSGIWEYHKSTGLVHRSAPTYTPINTTTITDYGQNRVSAVGALAISPISTTSVNGSPTVIAGIDYYTDASSSISGIFVDDPLDSTQKFGYMTTIWNLSAGIEEMWAKIFFIFRKFLNSNDKLYIKYRKSESTPIYITGTWTTTTSFTTSTDVTAYVGYEIEGIQGQGSGKCAHISSVTNNSGTYTVVVDETFTGVTNTSTAKFRIQNWSKGLSYSGQTKEWHESAIGGLSSQRIQLKVCLQFTGEDELYSTVLVNNTQRQLQ